MPAVASKPTPKLQAAICKAIREGNYREVAAKAAGVAVRTFYRWMRKGNKQKSGPYRQLWQAVLEAEAEAEKAMVKLVRLAAKDDAKHAEWWLERKFHERWGRDTGVTKQLLREVEELRRDLASRPGTSPEVPPQSSEEAAGGSGPAEA